MACPFQSYRIHTAFLFVLRNVVLLTFNIALGFKYFAPLFYGNWNHHPLQVDLRCHGQLGFDHRVTVAYSGIRRKSQRWFELLLVENRSISNSSRWRNCLYNDGHVSRKHQEKRTKISNMWYRPPYSPFMRGGCIESCSAMHHRQLVNPTARSWEQHRDGDLDWRNTLVVAIEFRNNAGGLMFICLSDNSCRPAVKKNNHCILQDSLFFKLSPDFS